MNIEQLINNKIFCATTRVYALITLLHNDDDDGTIIYINVKEIMDRLDLAENTVRSAINKLIDNDLIEMSGKKRAFILKSEV